MPGRLHRRSISCCCCCGSVRLLTTSMLSHSPEVRMAGSRSLSTARILRPSCRMNWRRTGRLLMVISAKGLTNNFMQIRKCRLLASREKWGEIVAVICSLHQFAPTRQHVLRNPQLIEDPRDDKINQIVNGLRLVIKTRRGRQHDRAHPAQLEHVLQMDV